MTVVMAGPVFAAGIVGTPAPDPLLDGAPDGPCMAWALEHDQAPGPDYAPGTDVQGHPVVPADVGAPPVAIPDQVIVPLPGGGGHRDHYHGRTRDHHRQWTGNGNSSGNGPYAVIDGRRLERLINPPGCGDSVAPPHPARDQR